MWFGRLQAPAPLPVIPIFLEKPIVKTERVDGKPWAYETTWEYVCAVDSAFIGERKDFYDRFGS